MKKIIIIVIALLVLIACEENNPYKVGDQHTMSNTVIDSIRYICIEDETVFCTKLNRSQFLIRYGEDEEGVYRDSMITNKERIKNIVNYLHSAPILDTLTYHSSYVSLNIKEQNGFVKLLEQSMDNRGLLMLYRSDGDIDYVWLSQFCFEREFFRCRFYEDFKVCIHNLNEELFRDSSIPQRN